MNDCAQIPRNRQGRRLPNPSAEMDFLCPLPRLGLSDVAAVDLGGATGEEIKLITSEFQFSL